MFDPLLAEPFVPFTISLALLFALFAMELVLLLMGLSLLGAGSEADIDTDIDADVDIDLDAPIDAGTLADLGIDLDAGALNDIEIDGDGLKPSVTPTTGPLSWLGIAKVPVMIWIASVLLAFGVGGVILQQVALASMGTALPTALSVPIAAALAVFFARTFSSAFARLLPKTESSALSNRHLGRRTGTVTQGTAERGNPAEVRVTDRHGNMHYLRAEPLDDTAHIPAGTDVLVLRHKRGAGYRLIPLSSETSLPL